MFLVLGAVEEESNVVSGGCVGAGRGEDLGCVPLEDLLSSHTLLMEAANSIGLPPNPGSGPFTMLAPTDEAIMDFLNSMGVSLQQMIDQPEILKGIRDYHSLLKPVRMEDFEDGEAYRTGLKASPCGNTELVAEVMLTSKAIA